MLLCRGIDKSIANNLLSTTDGFTRQFFWLHRCRGRLPEWFSIAPAFVGVSFVCSRNNQCSPNQQWTKPSLLYTLSQNRDEKDRKTCSVFVVSTTFLRFVFSMKFELINRNEIKFFPIDLWVFRVHRTFGLFIDNDNLPGYFRRCRKSNFSTGQHYMFG